VSGGPFGVEDSVRAGGGPLLALLGFIVLPIFWSLPEALITAGLAASFPENGGMSSGFPRPLDPSGPSRFKLALYLNYRIV
jgi:hypothetical protein